MNQLDFDTKLVNIFNDLNNQSTDTTDNSIHCNIVDMYNKMFDEPLFLQTEIYESSEPQEDI